MGKTTVHKAAKDGMNEKLKKLLKGTLMRKPINVNQTDDHSWTPLHYACYEGQIETINLLLGSGADVCSANLEGELPIHMCAKRGHLAAVKKIVEHGSPVLCTDNNGWTPRVAAEKVGHTDVSSFLTNEERCADR